MHKILLNTNLILIEFCTTYIVKIMSITDSFNPDHSDFNPDTYDSGIENEMSADLTHALETTADNEQFFGPDYFFNYELSWLDFNYRVLDQAQTDSNPILERVKFIGIVCSNLDEFFQKRVGGLQRQHDAGITSPTIDGLTPLQQLKKIRKVVKKMIRDYRTCFFDILLPELSNEGIHLVSYQDLSNAQKEIVDEYFFNQLFPILTPLVVDKSHPFPFISNKSRSFAIEINNPGEDDNIFARVKIPDSRPRWFVIEESKKKRVIINIDDIIQAHIGALFPGADVISANVFRVTRNAYIKHNEEEADDLLELIEEELRERRFAEVVRLEIDAETPDHVKEFLYEKLKVDTNEVFEMIGTIGLADCLSLGTINGFEHLKAERWTPALHPVFRHPIEEDAPDIFTLMRQGDFMVHHPYHSFASSVQRFIDEAANDPKVLAIKQTLYRTSSDSPIMHSIIKAAEAGKQVAVLVELKARFDEQQNIDWAYKLEKAGIHVSYGLPGLKIHSKITMVVRDEGDTLQRYAHIGTGNYHPGTANLYEDLGLFTTDEAICTDITNVFNYLTGYAPQNNYQKLLVAPHFLRSNINSLIDFEINEAKAGRPARIIAKMNSLEDPAIIQQLYEASSSGVEIDILVRGVCRLKPGVEGLSENIRIHSIIGRFLEHSRIFYFHHNSEDLYFIGSADIMHRNLDNRVEVITPIEQPNLKRYLQFVLFVSLKDNSNRWILKADGTYIKQNASNNNIYTHEILMRHTSSFREPIPSSFKISRD